jgi:hypothetical protein
MRTQPQHARALVAILATAREGRGLRLARVDDDDAAVPWGHRARARDDDRRNGRLDDAAAKQNNENQP